MTKKIFKTFGILFTCFICFQLLNHSIIENIIIGDPCKYDVDKIKTGKLFDLFYTISSNTGYHPEPSTFNFYFTTILSLLIGICLSSRLIWRNRKS